MVQRFMVIYPQHDSALLGLENDDLPFIVYSHMCGVYRQDSHHGVFMIYENSETNYWDSFDVTDLV